MHQAVPIGITVEGANILTRSMIIFGQGAIRSHPFARDEIDAVADRDVGRFDRAFFGHVNAIFRHAARAFLLAITNCRIYRAPDDGKMQRYYGQFARMSAAFALVGDAAMATLGGQFMRSE